MTPEQIKLIQDSWAAMEPIADAVPGIFYAKLFEIDPSTKPMFTHTNMDAQHAKLMDAIDLVADTAGNLGVLVPVLEDLGRRHVDYGVEDKHYDSVGAALISTLEAGLGEAFTDEVRTAWTDAYGLIATTMINAANEKAAA